MEKRTPRLTLNQETIRNLNQDELRNLRGAFRTGFFTCAGCPTTTNAPTCIECNPPAARRG